MPTKNMQKIIKEIDKITSTKPLIYFCREVERAIGLEEILSNYHICCIESSDTVKMLQIKGFSVFCLEDSLNSENEEVSRKSVNSLIKHKNTIDWLGKIIERKNEEGVNFFALSFLPTKAFNYQIEKLGGKLLGNTYEQFLRFENKMTSADMFMNSGIYSPAFLIESAQNLDYKEISSKLGDKFIIQTERGHTGSGTFVINNQAELDEIKNNLSGNQVKAVEFIDGKTFTVNAFVSRESYAIGPVQLQLNNINENLKENGVTYGNDWGFVADNMPKEVLQDIGHQVESVVHLMNQNNYLGLFGVDFIVSDDLIYIIEINARQTANIPLETVLSLENSAEHVKHIEHSGSENIRSMHVGLDDQGKINAHESQIDNHAHNHHPLMLFQIAIFLGIDVSEYIKSYHNMHNLVGAQVFIRSEKDDSKTQNDLQSGEYSFIDEKLVFEGQKYRIDQVSKKNNFLILTQKIHQRKNKNEELARLQFKTSVVDSNGHLKPEIKQLIKYVEEKIK